MQADSLPTELSGKHKFQSSDLIFFGNEKFGHRLRVMSWRVGGGIRDLKEVERERRRGKEHEGVASKTKLVWGLPWLVQW